MHKIIICAVAFLLYANTLGHDYTQDDAIVIYDNMYTQKGIAGIPGILSKDTFFGFFKVEGKDKLVSGGRYRPLSLISFAIEWQIFGKKPFIGHLLNVLFFALLCLLIYITSCRLFTHRFGKETAFFGLITTLVFACHPIHTEVVANIKGRDEIFCMLGAMGALYYSIKFIDTSKVLNLVLAGLSLFLGLMSKENAITFVAVIPLALFFFRSGSLKLGPIAALLASTGVFLAIRFSILGLDLGSQSMELMNNPFIKLAGDRYVAFTGTEKIGTIFFTLLMYLKLLWVPHPLTHDYYPRHIDIHQLMEALPLLSIGIYIAFIVLFFVLQKKNRVIAFSIFFFLATLSIVSNLVFPIGTNMSERFLFMPSLAFCWIIAYLIYLLKSRFKIIPSFILLLVYLSLLSFKTITRNQVWKDDFTLFTTDVKVSSNSAKLLNAAGGAMSTRAGKMEKGPQKTKMLQQAIGYLDDAINIHPNYKNAFLLRANSNYWLEKFPEAVTDYENALKIDPDYASALDNLPIALRDAGRFYGEQEGNLQKSLKYLQQANSINSDDAETNRLLGVCHGILKNHDKAVNYFQKVVKLTPKNPGAYVNLGIAYRNAGNPEAAQNQFDKALELDPKALQNFER